MDRSQTHQQDPEMENDKLKNEKRDNDSLFQEASQLNTEQICFSHTIDPILMGISRRTMAILSSM